MKKVIFYVGIVASLVLLNSNSGCEVKPSTNDKLAYQQEQLMHEANSQTGMPAIRNFQERKLMKMILELRDQEKLICYAYLVPEMTGKPVFLGKCIGYGLPYATQYTNPEVRLNGSSPGELTTIAQADPNGLFMPSQADATWLMMIDPATNEARLVYVESKILVSPFKLN